MLGPISGAHMNPAVSLVAAARRELSWGDAAAYIAAQFAFGILGAWAAHVMFRMAPLQLSVKARTGLGQWTGEFIATLGLILTILGTVRYRRASGCRRASRSTSSPLTGSLHPPALPTRRSLWRGASPTASPGSRRTTCQCSSSRNCSALDARPSSRGGSLTGTERRCHARKGPALPPGPLLLVRR